MLNDILTTKLDVVFCGTAKGKVSALKGNYYAGPGNKFYYILHATRLTPHKLKPNECWNINDYGIGLTDLVHNESGNDKEISSISYDVSGFWNKMKKFQPKIIAFTSKTAASFALGYQGETKMLQYGIHVSPIQDILVFVLPSTSGSARAYWDEGPWHDLYALLQKS